MTKAARTWAVALGSLAVVVVAIVVGMPLLSRGLALHTCDSLMYGAFGKTWDRCDANLVRFSGRRYWWVVGYRPRQPGGEPKIAIFVDLFGRTTGSDGHGGSGFIDALRLQQEQRRTGRVDLASYTGNFMPPPEAVVHSLPNRFTRINPDMAERETLRALGLGNHIGWMQLAGYGRQYKGDSRWLYFVEFPGCPGYALWLWTTADGRVLIRLDTPDAQREQLIRFSG